ncbi:LytTR family DNA-binding domain-containing protein [Motiliproteus sediminis]|uniref:LytTR family DNA-binding domain-containing protein n=1 Tax=Motiliproteus sediminis TaxID=1468178 RepID=UPI001AEFC6F8|nr:LytTR family DNA-binding domain-containing protein [Motiliproteus sediminis]
MIDRLEHFWVEQVRAPATAMLDPRYPLPPRTAIFRSAILLALLLALLLATLMGDEGADFSRQTRLLFWWLHCFPILMLLLFSAAPLMRRGVSVPVAVLLALVLTLPLAAVLSLGIDRSFGIHDPELASARWWGAMVVMETLDIAPAVAVLWGLVLLLAGSGRSSSADLVDSTADSAGRWPEILADVPPAKRGDLYAVQVDQHYLTVFSSGGETLVRCSLSDFLKTSAGACGVQISRSVWVSLGYVERVSSIHGTVYVFLPGGCKFAVSRRRIGLVRASLRVGRPVHGRAD